MLSSAIQSNEEFIHSSYIPLPNEQPSHGTYFQLATGMEAIVPSDSGISIDSLETGLNSMDPYLEIIMEPIDKFRFRYKSESGSHGKLRGRGNTQSKKTNFPTVKLHNCYHLPDKIKIKASLYTNEDNPKPHILELVGKNCADGACTEEVDEDGTAMFRYLEIESKKKEELLNILLTKKKNGLSGKRYNESEIKKEVQKEIKQLDMNSAVLCFEAFHENVLVCERVFSGVIKNLKSTSPDLRITRLSSSSGSCKGGNDIILLCEKINKDHIEIHFYQKNENDEIIWKEKAIFNPKTDVHHQVAIAFKTPPFRDNNGGDVHMELYRRNDEQSSESRIFTYIEDDIDSLRNSKKRKFNKKESAVEFQNSNQASSSRSIKSPSSIGSSTEDGSAYQVSSSTSSSDDNSFVHFFENLNNSELLGQLLEETDFTNYELVDYDNFDTQLNQFSESNNLSTTDNYLNEMQMDTAGTWTLDANDYILSQEETTGWQEETMAQSSLTIPRSHLSSDEIQSQFEYTINEEETTGWQEEIMNQSSLMIPISHLSSDEIQRQSEHTINEEETNGWKSQIIAQSLNWLPDYFLRPENITHDTPCSGGPGLLPAFGYLASTGLTSLWNATIGRAVSYNKPHLPNSKREICTQGHKVSRGNISELIDDAPGSSNKIVAQCALDFDGLSLNQEDNKRGMAPHIPRAVGNIVRPKNSTNEVSTSQRETKKIQEKNKILKINENFEHFKEGINQLMKNREEDVYLQYVPRLMSVDDENGNVFLHLAILEQSENSNLIAKILKMAPHDVNKQNRFKETPLLLATKNNLLKVVWLLLAHDGNPSIADIDGNNCFHIASKSNCSKIMKIMLLPNLRQGKRIPSINDFNYDGFTPLHLSVMKNAKECMQLLLQADADVNLNAKKNGSTAIHLATEQQPHLVSYLLLHPCIDLLNADFRGYSIIHALSEMKGVVLPDEKDYANLKDWALETLSLPNKNVWGSCSTDGSCDECTSDSDEDVYNEREAAMTPVENFAASFQSQRMVTVDIKENLNCLSEESEKRLTTYLDANFRWRKLGNLFMDEKVLNGVEKLSKGSSPSKLILKKVKKLYPNCDKTTMIEMLVTADLEDAVNILEG